MSIVGIGVDYSNICKDYNTAYLDRDNKDPATKKCMMSIVDWCSGFLTRLTEKFGYNLYNLINDDAVAIKEIASNRFLFYSLEKEIMLQSFVADKSYKVCNNDADWKVQNKEGLLIKNDEEGEGIYLLCIENSELHKWLKEDLKEFTLDEVHLQKL
jgi:hypothetical protein